VLGHRRGPGEHRPAVVGEQQLEPVDLVARVGAGYDVVLRGFSALEVEHQPELLERFVLGLRPPPLLALLGDRRLGRALLGLGRLAALLLGHAAPEPSPDATFGSDPNVASSATGPPACARRRGASRPCARAQRSTARRARRRAGPPAAAPR